MNKTINANIYGRMFTIDVDAYDLLSDYLDTLQQTFSQHQGDTEVVGDIESRISEILAENFDTSTHIISVDDIEAVIKRMGQPEDFIETGTEESATDTPDGYAEVEIDKERRYTPPPFVENPPKTKRRLYRDPRDKLVAGVCSGLAHYIGADPTLVRLIAVILIFISFSTALLAYVILWIIVPEARTPIQRMQMFGESPTIENIGRIVTNTFQSTARMMRGDTQPDDNTTQGRFIRRMAGIGKVVIFLLGIFCIPVLLILVLAFCSSVTGLILYNTDMWDWCANWLVRAVPCMEGNHTAMMAALWTGITFPPVAGIPVFALMRNIFSHKQDAALSSGMRTTLILVWSLFVVACFISMLIFRIFTGEWIFNIY